MTRKIGKTRKIHLFEIGLFQLCMGLRTSRAQSGSDRQLGVTF